MKSKNYNLKYFKERDYLDPIIASSILAFARKNRLKNILDVGCSTGKLVEYLNISNLRATGVDNSKIAVSIARKKTGSIQLCSATQLPFQKNTFDLVTCISTIEHLNKTEVKKFLNGAKRVLKPGGFVFIVTPNFASPLRLLQGQSWFGYQDPTHISFFTPNSLKLLLAVHSFKNINLSFKIFYEDSFNNSFPNITSNFPIIVKKLFVYLLYSSPLLIIRNSFWVSAQKSYD